MNFAKISRDEAKKHLKGGKTSHAVLVKRGSVTVLYKE